MLGFFVRLFFLLLSAGVHAALLMLISPRFEKEEPREPASVTIVDLRLFNEAVQKEADVAELAEDVRKRGERGNFNRTNMADPSIAARQPSDRLRPMDLAQNTDRAPAPQAAFRPNRQDGRAESGAQRALAQAPRRAREKAPNGTILIDLSVAARETVPETTELVNLIVKTTLARLEQGPLGDPWLAALRAPIAPAAETPTTPPSERLLAEAADLSDERRKITIAGAEITERRVDLQITARPTSEETRLAITEDRAMTVDLARRLDRAATDPALEAIIALAATPPPDPAIRNAAVNAVTRAPNKTQLSIEINLTSMRIDRGIAWTTVPRSAARAHFISEAPLSSAANRLAAGTASQAIGAAPISAALINTALINHALIQRLTPAPIQSSQKSAALTQRTQNPIPVFAPKPALHGAREKAASLHDLLADYNGAPCFLTKAQCPALTALGAVHSLGGPMLLIDLDNNVMTNSDDLTGTVRRQRTQSRGTAAEPEIDLKPATLALFILDAAGALYPVQKDLFESSDFVGTPTPFEVPRSALPSPISSRQHAQGPALLIVLAVLDIPDLNIGHLMVASQGSDLDANAGADSGLDSGPASGPHSGPNSGRDMRPDAFFSQIKTAAEQRPGALSMAITAFDMQ